MEHRHIYDRMKEDPVFGVIGGGSWATALVKLLSENGRRLRAYREVSPPFQVPHISGTGR